MSAFLPSAACLTVALLISVPCFGAEYFLSPDGSDDAEGTR